MKKFLTILAISSLFYNADAMEVERKEGYQPKFSKNARALASHVQDYYLKVVPGKVYFPNGKQKEKLNESFFIIEKIVNSQEFKEKVISYIGEDGQRRYTSNNGLSNEEIYEKLMQAIELLVPNSEGEMNFDLTYYNRFWSKVIAYTNPGKNNWININWKFYKNFEIENMASNLVHEWIHLMGFYHDSARDHDSVPYAVGYIVEDLAKKYHEQGYLD